MKDGMPVDVGDGDDWTALHVTTMYNRTEVIKHLLNEGADVNRQDPYTKETPLHWAVCNNSSEAAQMLIENGVDINLINYHNRTPLDYARKGSEVARLLL